MIGLIALMCAWVVAAPVVVAQPASPRARAAASYETYSGPVNGFYDVPSPLPAGNPGDLIRVQDVANTGGFVTKRIMYHTIDGAGRDRAVTGTITYPLSPAPAQGRLVMSVANGTVGLAPKCALSRGNRTIPQYGLDAVSVATDYVGLGPNGEVHAYLSRESEGHSVIDAVRAARNLSEANAGTDFVVLGGSQGGHGALSASELAASYAPELDLLGTVALAPAAVFDKTYGPLDEMVTRVVGAMGFLGVSTEHPEIDIADYLTSAGQSAMDAMKTMCTDEIIPTVLSIPMDGFYSPDPLTVEPTRSIMIANDVGFVAASSPVLLVQGTADQTVSPLRTDDLFARMCDAGQVVEYRVIPDADHGNVYSRDATAINAWLADRVAGIPAPTACAAVPPSTTTTTTTTTIATPPTTTSAPTSISTTTLAAATLSPSTSAPGDTSTTLAAPVGDQSLARTGASSDLAVLLGLLCVAAGTSTVIVARRGRP